MKYLSIFLALIFAFPTYGGSPRSRQRIVNHHYDVERTAQKIIEYSDFGQLSIIAVPVTDLGLQYYYQSPQPLRGRGLSDEDRTAIVEEIVQGVLAGIDERFEIPTTAGNGDGGETDPVETDPPSTSTGSALDAKVLALMTNRCATCHTEGQLEKPNMPVLLASDGGLKAPLEDKEKEELRRFRIWDSVYHGRMPKNNGVLSQEDTDVFYQWIKEAK